MNQSDWTRKKLRNLGLGCAVLPALLIFGLGVTLFV
jgi:hypothetical protein